MHSPDGIIRGRNLKFHVYAGHYRSRGRRRMVAVDGHANTQTHTYKRNARFRRGFSETKLIWRRLDRRPFGPLYIQISGLSGWTTRENFRSTLNYDSLSIPSPLFSPPLSLFFPLSRRRGNSGSPYKRSLWKWLLSREMSGSLGIPSVCGYIRVLVHARWNETQIDR